MEQLRRDDLIAILLLLKLPQLMKFCQTYTAVADICDNEMFWRLKVQHDISAHEIPQNVRNYREFYLNYFVKTFPVLDRTQFGSEPKLFTIQVHRDETYESVVNKIKSKMGPSNRPNYIGYSNKNKNQYIYIQPTLDQVTSINSMGLSLWNDAGYLFLDRCKVDFDGDECEVYIPQILSDFLGDNGNRYINQQQIH